MKKLMLMTLLMLFTLAPGAFAHTDLESSTPGDGEIVKEALQGITLTFEGKIEQGSRFELRGPDGKEVPIEALTVTENQVTGTLPDKLDNGEHTVDWSIISADGHQMEGDFSFTMQIEEQAVTDSAEPETVKEPTSDQPAPDTETADESSSYLVPVIIVILLAAVILSFVMIKRKK